MSEAVSTVLEDGAEFEGLIDAWLLDGRGGGRRLDWSEACLCEPQGDEWLWLHFDYSKPSVQQWMRHASNLSEFTVEALLQSETRPRALTADGGLLVFLRGVNLNPGANPEDMVSIRMWVGKNRVISLRMRRLLSIDDMRLSIVRNEGPENTGSFLAVIVDLILTRINSIIDELYDRVDELEDLVIVETAYQQRQALADVRRQLIALRRFLAPQRAALNRLASERHPLISEFQRLQLQESHDHLTRMIEDLDSARERATVTQEALVNRLAELTNERMYVLSIVSVIFLPMSFVTGLLGINVGGMPGANTDWAFIAVAALMLVMAIGLWIYLRLRRWF